MQTHARDMYLTRAIVTGTTLLAASSGLVLLGDEATDPIVIAGVVGIVVAASLLVLTALAARWRGGARSYVSTRMEPQLGSSASIAAAFDGREEQPLPARYEDSAAV